MAGGNLSAAVCATRCSLDCSVELTCTVLGAEEDPSHANSVSAVLFFVAAAALLCAAGFVYNVSRGHTLFRHLSRKKQGRDRLGFVVAPFLCAVFSYVTLVEALSILPASDSATSNSTHVGCECVASMAVQKSRFVLQSLVVPLILVVAFEQAYIVHKRKTANFCGIRFDRGHRLTTSVRSFILRFSMWLIAGGLFIFNLVINILVALDMLALDEQQRFRHHSLLSSPSSGDVVPFISLIIFSGYHGVALWNYGRHYSLEITAMPCNNWMYMMLGTGGLIIGSLLPPAVTVYTHSISLLLYFVCMILLERQVIMDLQNLFEWESSVPATGAEAKPFWAQAAAYKNSIDQDSEPAAMFSNPMPRRKDGAAKSEPAPSVTSDAPRVEVALADIAASATAAEDVKVQVGGDEDAETPAAQGASAPTKAAEPAAASAAGQETV